MRIQHNIAALNSHRQLTSNNSAVGKNLEKLSSGYRINRAGDDAAGLAISEKMRAQITGLNTASKNAQDGISLVQTAEGALTEVHSMLNRMTELAGQAANGTYQDAVDRENAMKELDSLRSEIDRISEGTNFNGIKLLDGSMGGAQAGANIAVGAGGNVNAFNAKVVGQAGLTVSFASAAGAVGTKGVTAAWGANGALTITLGTGAAGDITEDAINEAISKATGTKPEGASSVKVSITGGKITTSAATGVSAATAPTTLVDPEYASVSVAGGITLTATKGGSAYNGASTITSGASEGVTVNGTNNTFAMQLDTNKSYSAADLNTMLSAAGASYRFDFDGTKLGSAMGAVGGTTYTTAGGAGVEGNGLTLQIGDTAEAFNQLTVDVASMSANSLGLSTVDISTQNSAKSAVDVIKKAINTVSSTRGDLGAIQNRLEHTINNLGVTAENMTAAESRIRDVDMAQEMMTYTKNNILTQASQAMLAQANQLPQGVLQLLQ